MSDKSEAIHESSEEEKFSNSPGKRTSPGKMSVKDLHDTSKKAKSLISPEKLSGKDETIRDSPEKGKLLSSPRNSPQKISETTEDIQNGIKPFASNGFTNGTQNNSDSNSYKKGQLKNEENLKQGESEQEINAPVLSECDAIEDPKSSSPDSSTFDMVNDELVVEEQDIGIIMDLLRDHQYSPFNDPDERLFGAVYYTCKYLFDKDYIVELVDNYKGEISYNYPHRLIIPVAQKEVDGNSEGLTFIKKEYAELIKSAYFARCRSRFAAPVIFADNKFISRSATLAVRKGASYEQASKIYNEFAACGVTSNIIGPIESSLGQIYSAAETLIKPDAMEIAKEDDAKILKSLHIEFICDLMVENRKIFKEFITVSSSEKINKETYSDFKLQQMPYPGCEFFRDYHENKRNPVGLKFNWNNKDYVDLQLSDSSLAESLGIELSNYKDWDIVEMTQNYMKILLSYFVQGSGGLLVHCISGWDRTPVIISLLRMSLWADGIIHEELNKTEIAYLTLAYDWFLFGHDLPSRLEKKEEIMHFCFNGLSMIATDEYSATRMFKELALELKGDRKFPEFTAGRRAVLKDLSEDILIQYDKSITTKMGFNFEEMD